MYTVDHFYFHNNFSNSGSIFIFLTVKFSKDLRRKLELKLPPLLKLLPHYLVKSKWSSKWKSVHISFTA